MLATECSNPRATNAAIGKTIATPFPRNGGGSQAEPNGQTYQRIAENSAEQQFDRRKRDLINGDSNSRGCYGLGGAGRAKLEYAREPYEDGRRQTSDKVSDINESPIPGQQLCRNPSVGPSHNNQIVSHEKFCTGDDDQHQAQREG